MATVRNFHYRSSGVHKVSPFMLRSINIHVNPYANLSHEMFLHLFNSDYVPVNGSVPKISFTIPVSESRFHFPCEIPFYKGLSWCVSIEKDTTKSVGFQELVEVQFNVERDKGVE